MCACVRKVKCVCVCMCEGYGIPITIPPHQRILYFFAQEEQVCMAIKAYNHVHVLP